MDVRLSIAVSGKGGVGKTNLSALLIRRLSKLGSVLAIDADPDSNLPQALGVPVTKTVGDSREAILNAPARSEIAKDKRKALEKSMYEVVEEFPQFDLVVMGRPEGSGCYCGVNSIVSRIIDYIASSYNFTLVDCEAGLEHLSRRTTRDVDIIIVVTEPTKNGVLTAKRVKELAKELSIQFGWIMIIANKVTPEVKPMVDRIAQESGLSIDGYVPYDPLMAQFDILGKPVIELPEDSPASQAMEEVCTNIINYAQNREPLTVETKKLEVKL